MHPSTALARVALDELISQGVCNFVLSPGSRSAPLAFELAALERAGKIRLHVRIDERSAGFTALGIARITGRPTAVVCTSGSAVANLAPAIVEAAYAGIPLIAVTADRPWELRNTGANQTIDQVGIFGAKVRRAVDIDCGEKTAGQVSNWRSQIARCVWAAMGSEAAASGQFGHGPVQINLAFREPLTPDESDDWPEPLRAETAQSPTFDRAISEPINYALGDIGLSSVPARGLVLVGDVLNPADSAAAVALAEACGWPIISEPSGNATAGSSAISAASVLLGNDEWLAAHAPELIVSVSRFGLSRTTMKLVRSAKVLVAVGLSGRDRPDPLRSAASLVRAVPLPPIGDPVITWTGPDPDWAADWLEASEAATDAVSEVLDSPWESLTGLHVAREVWTALSTGDVLLAAASRPVRDLEIVMTAREDSPRIIGNRGASGIDGLVSTAVGAALASPGTRTVALLGDLAFLHDHNGLLYPPEESAPNLTIVVPDNNGGGIFSSLEQGGEQFAADFERIFGTPHNRDLMAIASAAGAGTFEVTTTEELNAALQAALDIDGLTVIIAKTADRGSEEEVQAAVREAAASAVP